MNWIQLKNITSLDKELIEINEEGVIRKVNNLEVITFFIDKNGYPTVKVLLNNYKKQIAVHRLQLLVSGTNPNLVCHHINHIKTDNRRSNLMFLSVSEHTKIHRIDEAQKEENKICYVPSLPVSIIKFIYFCRIRKLLSVKHLSNSLEVSTNVIYSIQNKKSYKRIINHYFGKNFR